MQAEQQVLNYIINYWNYLFYLSFTILQIHDYKVRLATAEGTNKESMTTISEKSKEITHLKSELNNVKQTNESLCDQVYDHFNIFSV
jgi:hypothetical protein